MAASGFKGRVLCADTFLESPSVPRLSIVSLSRFLQLLSYHTLVFLCAFIQSKLQSAGVIVTEREKQILGTLYDNYIYEENLLLRL